MSINDVSSFSLIPDVILTDSESGLKFIISIEGNWIESNNINAAREQTLFSTLSSLTTPGMRHI